MKKPGNGENRLFHVSPASNYESILSGGLLPQNREHLEVERAPAVYLLQTADQARDFAFWFALETRREMDVWCVNVPKGTLLVADPARDMAKSYTSWMITSPIPPECLLREFSVQIPSSALEAPPFDIGLDL